MIRREGKGPPSRDLLVCFPTRAHLTLMHANPVSSPRRNLHRHYHNHLRKSMRGGSMGSSHASPYLLTGSKQMGSDNLSEPTSPKVTCAGQIKARHSTRSCKNWQTVMDEIEKLHNDRKKKPTWVEALGFKKEVMHFLSCLRRIKFDFHCLGTLSHVDITSDDEDEDEDNNDKDIKQRQDLDQDHNDLDNDEEVSSVFSKWFMVLQENQECGVFEKDEKPLKSKEIEDHPCLPPTNALLLMRCHSAPAKSWMEEKEEEEEEEEEEREREQKDDHDDDHEHDYDHGKEEEHADKDEKLEEKETKRKSLMELMKTENDFYKLSIDIAKETWVIGGIHKDPFSRSRSWKK